MRKRIVLIPLAAILLTIAVFASGCASRGTVTEANPRAAQADGNQEKSRNAAIIHTSLSPDAAFKADLVIEPTTIQAGEPTTLSFTVKNAQGATVKDLQIVHEKPMHLLVVSSDLAEFNHIHPELQPDGSYKVTHTFAKGGSYLLYADYTPRDTHQLIDRFDVKVSGPERARAPLVEDQLPVNAVDGISVAMKPDKPLRAGEEVLLNFTVTDAQTGKPVTDLQPYLGAMAHFVVISEDTSKFLHVHPMEAGQTPDAAMKHGKMEMPVNNAQPSTTVISAHTTFPSAGLFKLWAQFQRGGRVITVPFVLRVAEGANAPAQDVAAVPADAIKVAISSSGYEPSQIKVKRGQPIKLAFYRADAQNCASEVVFPSLNVRKPLPVGQTTIVELTPQQAGELSFACGMGMLQGKLVVQ